MGREGAGGPRERRRRRQDPDHEEITDLRARLERREAYRAAIRKVTDLVLPTRILRDTPTLAGEAGLIHNEGDAEGDIVIWLPSRRVLITGDPLDDLPYSGDGRPLALVGRCVSS